MSEFSHFFIAKQIAEPFFIDMIQFPVDVWIKYVEQLAAAHLASGKHLCFNFQSAHEYVMMRFGHYFYFMPLSLWAMIELLIDRKKAAKKAQKLHLIKHEERLYLTYYVREHRHLEINKPISLVLISSDIDIDKRFSCFTWWLPEQFPRGRFCHFFYYF